MVMVPCRMQQIVIKLHVDNLQLLVWYQIPLHSRLVDWITLAMHQALIHLRACSAIQLANLTIISFYDDHFQCPISTSDSISVFLQMPIGDIICGILDIELPLQITSNVLVLNYNRPNSILKSFVYWNLFLETLVKLVCPSALPLLSLAPSRPIQAFQYNIIHYIVKLRSTWVYMRLC